MANSAISSINLKIGGLALKTLVTILVFINAFSGIIGGIWLAILGQWGVIIAGFGYSIAMPFIYAIVALPNMGLVLLLSKAVERRSKFFTGFLGLISGLYTYGLFTFWVMLVFGNFVFNAELKDFFPLLLWGYSTVMAPLSYMASKEDDDSSSGFALLFAQVMYLVFTTIWFFGIQSGTALFLIVAPAVAVALFSMTLMVSSLSQQQRQTVSESLVAGDGNTTGRDGSDDPLFEQAKQIVIENGQASASVLQRRLHIGYARAARLLDLLEDTGVIDRPPAQEYENSRNDEPTENLYDDAVKVARGYGRVSSALLQRELRIGYPKAARLIDLMEEDGIIDAADGNKPRTLL